ncbi:hypothetical protein SSX86_012041 [Deinandra increscens subsp. villosa]|uniref:Uncharacterized protein n=1 Tax=Deinandra increscens subsp. villosa TaxID=3103831 RepID=A0AAP0D3G3_9ASTR
MNFLQDLHSSSPLLKTGTIISFKICNRSYHHLLAPFIVTTVVDRNHHLLQDLQPELPPSTPPSQSLPPPTSVVPDLAGLLFAHRRSRSSGSRRCSSSGDVTRIMLGVNESSIKGYPHASISSKSAFDWTLNKIIRSNTAGFKLLFLQVQVPDDDGIVFTRFALVSIVTTV